MDKIKAVLFDMDGVLIEAKEWHYEALNRALALFGVEISRYEHLVTYDGLPTRMKLEMLTQDRGLPFGLHEFINDLKQKYTIEMVHTRCKPIYAHEYMLSRLKQEGYKLAVCSNSINSTIELMLERANVKQYFDCIISADHVDEPKPAPDMYLKAMKELAVTAEDSLIVEDNENGIKAAVASGGHLLQVYDVHEVTYQMVNQKISELV